MIFFLYLWQSENPKLHNFCKQCASYVTTKKQERSKFKKDASFPYQFKMNLHALLLQLRKMKFAIEMYLKKCSFLQSVHFYKTRHLLLR